MLVFPGKYNLPQQKEKLFPLFWASIRVGGRLSKLMVLLQWDWQLVSACLWGKMRQGWAVTQQVFVIKYEAFIGNSWGGKK